MIIEDNNLNSFKVNNTLNEFNDNLLNILLNYARMIKERKKEGKINDEQYQTLCQLFKQLYETEDKNFKNILNSINKINLNNVAINNSNYHKKIYLELISTAI